MNALLFEQVCKSFGEVCAVDKLNAHIPVGCIYGFLGPNGAGKTTTIRMIMNIIRPDSGQIKIFGNGLAIEQAKERIGYMPEERGLYRKMKVGKVLAYFGSIKGLTATESARRTKQWLELIGLSGWAEKRVEELSRGMHQKLQFAVTSINDPDLLILDEPFSGLDPVNLDLLKEIIIDMRKKGKTIIFSTHVMHEAEQLCDFILLINKGKAVLDGRLDEIRSKQQSHAIIARLEGDTSFIEQLAIVTAVRHKDQQLEITLAENIDPQQLLQELVGRVQVLAFEVKIPSLHEIFIHLVGQNNAENS